MPYCPAAFKRVLARSAGLLLALVLGITASGLSYSQSFAADPAPDLTVTDIVLTPADPAIDDAVTVTVTVRNQGSAAAGLSLLAGYADSTLLAAENINNLGAGAVATKSFTWVAQPGTHNIKAVADSSGTIAESDETNNTRTYTLTTLAADLTVQSVTWTPAEPSRGDNIVFSVTIKNQGNAKSRVTNVGFFIDGNSRGYQDIAIIDPGATLTRTYNWVAQAGQHTLRAIVDENNASKESDETNNERTLTFSTLPPDLVVQQIIWSPVNPSKSDNVTFTATVKNQGSGRADSSHLAYYINGEYQSAMAVSAIEAGVSANVTFVWIARADEHDIKAVADYFGKITESDESNNENTVSFLTLAPDLTVKSITWTPANAGVGATVTFTVTVRNMGEGRAEASRAAYYIDGQYLGYLAIPAIAANTETTKTFTWLATTGTHAVAVTADDENLIKETTDENNKLTINVPIIPPDLIIPNIAWSPEKPAIGDIITFTVTVKNQGGGTADNFRVSFYLDDTLLTSAYIDRITAGSAENVTTTWKSENGIHVFKAIADYDKHVTENDEDNNQNSISVMPHMPDLLISNITWSPPGLPSGSEVTFSIVVKNQGSRDSGQSRLAYYVDGTIVGYQDIPSIEAGATVTEKFPWVVAAGNHKIDVVADSVNQVTEVDEENNTRVVNIPPPDLVVRDISWSPPDAAIGETVTFTATVLNQGSGQAPESQVSYYIDGEAAGTWSLPEMNPGGTSSPTFAWTAKAGAHVIRIAADAVNRVTESDETNNEKQTNFGTLTADLVIQSVGWYIDDPRIKDMVTFTVTIENQGSTAAGGSKLSYSINDNPGVPEAIKPILPGAALTVKLFANLGAGNHTLTLTADADNAVTEIDETNNGKTLSFSTIAPDLMVKSITWSPEKFAAGENVTITVEVENQGRTRAANTRVELRLGGASLGYAEIEEVVVGTPVKRDFIWTAVPGVHEINGIIDVDGLVLESNEANNTAITTLSLEVPVLSKKPAKISTAGAPDKGFLESSWWLILLAAAVLGGAAFYLALKAVRKS